MQVRVEVLPRRDQRSGPVGPSRLARARQKLPAALLRAEIDQLAAYLFARTAQGGDVRAADRVFLKLPGGRDLRLLGCRCSAAREQGPEHRSHDAKENERKDDSEDEELHGVGAGDVATPPRIVRLTTSFSSDSS